MKSILFLFCSLLMSQTVMATEETPAFKVATQISFGYDATFKKSFPSEKARQDAKVIYTLLGGRGDKIQIESEKDLYSLEADADGFMLLMADQEERITRTVKEKRNNFVFPMELGDISFYGPAAEMLFKKLRAKPVVRVGATTKSVANLTCVRGSRSGIPQQYKCSFKDTSWITLHAE